MASSEQLSFDQIDLGWPALGRHGEQPSMLDPLAAPAHGEPRGPANVVERTKMVHRLVDADGRRIVHVCTVESRRYDASGLIYRAQATCSCGYAGRVHYDTDTHPAPALYAGEDRNAHLRGDAW